jgi:hypothetical protein
MKPRYSIPLAMVVIVVAAVGVYLYASSQANATECISREDDPEGYLFKICTYIKEQNLDVSPGYPDAYNIRKIEEGEHQGREVFTIYLDCCYMGDIAYIDKQSGEVIDFRLGPK